MPGSSCTDTDDQSQPQLYSCVGLFYIYCGDSTVGGRRQNTILVKVPAHDESQEEQESGSETSDSMPGGGQGSAQNHNNVTLITLNSEGKSLVVRKNTLL